MAFLRRPNPNLRLALALALAQRDGLDLEALDALRSLRRQRARLLSIPLAILCPYHTPELLHAHTHP